MREWTARLTEAGKSRRQRVNNIMVEVIINWIYILATSGIIGCAVLYPFYRYGKYCFRDGSSFLFAGLTAVTVYAQIFSLFHGVGGAANLILILACLIILLLLGKKIGEMLKPAFGSADRIRLAVIVLLFFFFAYGTSVGNIHYDSNLYHAQSIRWIEEYGTAPGIGNLQSRLAYNSSSFALSALYSMAFLLGRSLHTVAGLLAFVCAAVSLRLLEAFRRKKLLVSDFARLGMFYYVTVIYKEMNSPASDYFTMLVIFYIIVKWIDLWEAQEKNAAPFALLSVLGVFAVSLKLSAGVILLLVIKPAAMLLRDKKIKEIILYLCMGLLVIVPFLARNVIISGWLVYPFTVLDWFRVDWKMPAFVARYDAQEIQVWARGIYDVAKFNMPFQSWAVNWFRQELTGTEKLLVAVAAVSALLMPLFAAAAFWKKRREEYGLVLVQSTLLLCFGFWLFSAPMMRYGYAYPILLPITVLGPLVLRAIPQKQQIFTALMAAFLAVRGLQMGAEAVDMYRWFGINVQQVDYGKYDAEEEKVGNITVYVPAEGDQAGYDVFPSTPRVSNVRPRGERIQDGFCYEQEESGNE